MKSRKPSPDTSRPDRAGAPHAPAKASYHHGDLARALVTAAREILEQEGLAKLSLRAAARRAGVSQAAPYHHFKDKQALLASIAAQGHVEFNAAMQRRMADAGEDPSARLLACGVAYVQFATDNPALFRLMFGSIVEHCDAHTALVEAGQRSFQTLEDATRAVAEGTPVSPDELRLRALESWCSVHGLSTLLIDGALDPATFGMRSAADLAQFLLKSWKS